MYLKIHLFGTLQSQELKDFFVKFKQSEKQGENLNGWKIEYFENKIITSSQDCLAIESSSEPSWFFRTKSGQNQGQTLLFVIPKANILS